MYRKGHRGQENTSVKYAILEYIISVTKCSNFVQDLNTKGCWVVIALIQQKLKVIHQKLKNPVVITYIVIV